MEPSQAMSIGMEGKFKEWVKGKYRIIPTNDEVALHYAVIGNRLDFVKYLVGIKKVKVASKIINVAITNKYDDIVLYLITAGDQQTIDYIKSKKK